VAGTKGVVTASWQGLVPGRRYLGSLSYHALRHPADIEDGLLRYTHIRVDP
jgi:hypothetical protein